jgi:hypothetical protein
MHHPSIIVTSPLRRKRCVSQGFAEQPVARQRSQLREVYDGDPFMHGVNGQEIGVPAVVFD